MFVARYPFSMRKQDLYQFLYGTTSETPEARPRWVGMAMGFVIGLVMYLLASNLNSIL
jgi:hypothetical protein